MQLIRLSLFLSFLTLNACAAEMQTNTLAPLFSLSRQHHKAEDLLREASIIALNQQFTKQVSEPLYITDTKVIPMGLLVLARYYRPDLAASTLLIAKFLAPALTLDPTFNCPKGYLPIAGNIKKIETVNDCIVIVTETSESDATVTRLITRFFDLNGGECIEPISYDLRNYPPTWKCPLTASYEKIPTSSSGNLGPAWGSWFPSMANSSHMAPY